MFVVIYLMESNILFVSINETTLFVLFQVVQPQLLAQFTVALYKCQNFILGTLIIKTKQFF